MCVTDETINHITSECSKLMQRDYKTRQPNDIYMNQNPSWRMRHKIPCDFKIQT